MVSRSASRIAVYGTTPSPMSARPLSGIASRSTNSPTRHATLGRPVPAPPTDERDAAPAATLGVAAVRLVQGSGSILASADSAALAAGWGLPLGRPDGWLRLACHRSSLAPGEGLRPSGLSTPYDWWAEPVWYSVRLALPALLCAYLEVVLRGRAG